MSRILCLSLHLISNPAPFISRPVWLGWYLVVLPFCSIIVLVGHSKIILFLLYKVVKLVSLKVSYWFRHMFLYYSMFIGNTFHTDSFRISTFFDGIWFVLRVTIANKPIIFSNPAFIDNFKLIGTSPLPVSTSFFTQPLLRVASKGRKIAQLT